MGEIERKVKAYLAKIKKEDKKINAFLSLNPNALEEAKIVDAKKKKGKLAGYVFGVKSNICVSGLEANCASKTLEGWKASYDASVIAKIKAEDGLIIATPDPQQVIDVASEYQIEAKRIGHVTEDPGIRISNRGAYRKEEVLTF